MHSNHESFERGVSQSRTVSLTFLADDEPPHELTRMCGPLYYSRGRAETDEPECYYFWDFEAEEGYNFLALTPSEIVGMELTEDSFEFEEISGSRQGAGNTRKGKDGSDS